MNATPNEYSTNLTVFSVLYSFFLDQLIYISVSTYFNRATLVHYLNNSKVVKMLNDCECYYFRLNNNIRGEQNIIYLGPEQHFP